MHVSYGVAGLKTHAKVLLIVRREGDSIRERRYVHIGTGNYNPRTARFYTDFGLLSVDPELGADLSDLFNVLTGFGQPTGYRKLLVAPTWMKPAVPRIDRSRNRRGPPPAARDEGILAQDERARGSGQCMEALYRDLDRGGSRWT